jgi:heme-degrading monooxygenase HmoA
MKCRIWRTQVVPGRFGEYERFAREVSLPMFQSQAGYRGVIMTGDGSERMVITLWENDHAIAALDTSPTYRETVSKIIATGFLTGEQSVEVYDTHLSDIETIRL